MEQLAVSELQQITVEIKVLKQQTAQNIIEIGRRLKRGKETQSFEDFKEWLEQEVDFTWQTAYKFIQVAEEFGDFATSRNLSTGKLFELIALPQSVDRKEFVETPHTVPSTGETKTVDEMTVKELREVKAQLKKAQEELKATNEQAASLMERDRRIREENERLKREKNPEPQVVEKTVFQTPPNVQQQLRDYQITLADTQRQLSEAKDTLKSIKIQSTDGFDAEQAKRQREKLQLEADISTLQIRVYITDLLRKVGAIAFMEGALAASDPSTKKQLEESIKHLEAYLAKVKAALNSRIIVEDAQYQEG